MTSENISNLKNISKIKTSVETKKKASVKTSVKTSAKTKKKTSVTAIVSQEMEKMIKNSISEEKAKSTYLFLITCFGLLKQLA